ncbi:enolase C-terminal domain-like protein [Streptomyces djakartensis]|uniref:enolase C-terminal domain-like protein n=1 Tax=Streptomyces djakartensis TaxID=68193 RepID=UPI0035711F6B
MAEAHDVTMAPHCPLGPVAPAASLQIAFCVPNFLSQGQMMPHVDLLIASEYELPLVAARPQRIRSRAGGAGHRSGGGGRQAGRPWRDGLHRRRDDRPPRPAGRRGRSGRRR